MTGFDASALNYSKGNGVVTVIAQDAVTGAVLMVAHADPEAIWKTLETGEMHYTSRTRGLWHKGATSGNVQRVVSLTADCDGDAVLARVRIAGPACHQGSESCFGKPRSDVLSDLENVIEARAGESPSRSASYTRRLLDDRNLRLKKISEEASELVVACADGDPERAREEAADLIYHVFVALYAVGVSHEAVLESLADRKAAARR
ncbi:MAG TPA: bifunctional phosphoribosyl-AMP cyclohydrolase/phosphoribosyl-ATP diphosphatase HisIE [Gemmatimonadaceae bacterium]|jgi:phosphoribosyl-ATP pyrophosphohydrolase/phosphoribosyl-AMP cyclohydrolase